MDIFAHALWANALARKGNDILEKKQKPKIKLAWAMFWGIFPDLFAFGIPIILSLPAIIGGIFTHASWYSLFPNYTLAQGLYDYSHSLIIFALVFFGAWAVYKRPRLELLGWMLHILIDIPSHTSKFFPTPFLFPVSNFHFPWGIYWGTPIYMIINYSLLAIIYLYFLIRKHKNAKS